MKELALHLLDLVENSVNAGARRVDVFVEENFCHDQLRFRVSDDGCGMDDELLHRIRDPFATTQKKITGLGIPFLCQSAEQAGGEVAITSSPGRGTVVEAVWQFSHWDRPPMGSMAATVTSFFTMPCRICFRHRAIGRSGGVCWEMELDSLEFGGTPLTAGSLRALGEYLQKQYALERK